MLGGMGDQVAMCIQQATAGILAVALGFWRGPALAGVVMAFLPLMILAVAPAMSALKGGVVRINENYAHAGEMATEAISSIRTVSSSCGEGAEVERYAKCLESAERAGTRKSFAVGTAFGALWFFLMCTYAVGLWYGGTQVARWEILSVHVLQYD